MLKFHLYLFVKKNTCHTMLTKPVTNWIMVIGLANYFSVATNSPFLVFPKNLRFKLTRIRDFEVGVIFGF